MTVAEAEEDVGADPNLYAEDLVLPFAQWQLDPRFDQATTPTGPAPGVKDWVGTAPPLPGAKDWIGEQPPAPGIIHGGSPTKGDQQVAAPAAREEVPAAGLVPPSTNPVPPEPRLSPEEEAQIEIDAPPPPEADAVSGAAPLAPHTVSDELADQGATVSQEALPPHEQAEVEEVDRLSQDPRALARWLVDHDQRQRDRYAALEQQRIADDADRAARSLHVYATARQEAQTERAKINEEAKALAAKKPDPNLHQGLLDNIATLIGVTVGGAMTNYTGGRNMALEQFNKRIQANIDAQNTQIGNQWKALGMRSDAVQQDLASAGDLYRAQETFRIGAYQRAQDAIAAEMQNFDPRGSTALQLAQMYRAIEADKQKAGAAVEERYYKLKKENAEANLAEANARKADAEAMRARAKAGAGGPAAPVKPNTKPTVFTGIMSPFRDANGDFVPIMGVRSLDQKGEDKERGKVQDLANSYSHIQDGFRRLDEIGAKIDYHKNVANDWDKWQATLVDEYDKESHSLVVYLTKELGDKLTQGQITEQKERIPALTKWLSQRDVQKEIHDAQEKSDVDFDRDMTGYGVDATNIIDTAKSNRKPAPRPTSKDAMFAAQEADANAKTPDEKAAAKASIEAAENQRQTEIEHEQQTETARKQISSLHPAPIVQAPEGDDPDVKARYAALNEATDTYNQRLADYHKANDALVQRMLDKKHSTKDLADDRKRLDEIREKALAVTKAHDGMLGAQKRIDDLRGEKQFKEMKAEAMGAGL